MKGIASAVLAGLITFFLLFFITDLNGGVSGLIGAGVAIVAGGLASATTLPTPRRER